MTYMRTRNLRALAITSLTLVVLLIVACGTAGQPVQQAEPQVVEKEVVKEVEVTREVQVEVGEGKNS